MFEDSLMESQNRLSSPNQRWSTILSLTLQSSVVAAIIALPLLHPETIPFHPDAPKIMLPLRPAAPIPHVDAQAASPAPAALSVFTHDTRISPLRPTNLEAPPTTEITESGMGDPNGITNAIATASPVTMPHVSVAPAKPAAKGILHISTGVSSGLLLAPIKPIYPRIAIAARVGGTVKVEAVISKSGEIESAHVVSGPEMLRQAALDAIRNAYYTPYMLNGSPTEVETAITVNFQLSSLN